MTLARGSPLPLAAVVTCLALWPSPLAGRGDPAADEGWEQHPALAEPDEWSHRGGKTVAADIADPRVLRELSRRFRATEPLRLAGEGGAEVAGAGDFELRQEYLLRLLDHYWFSRPRLAGMSRAEVAGIFGPLGGDPDRAVVSAGRDTFCVWFEGGRVSGAFYAMGY